jgi:putative peptidoglycan lipid II flippase
MQAFTRWFRRQSSWIESQQASILSAATIILVANVTAGLSGLLKNRAISWAYVTPQYKELIDSYWVAFRIPDFTFQIMVLGALSAAFVPIFSQLYKRDKNEAFSLGNQALILILSGFIAVSLIVAIFARPILTLLTAGEFNEEKMRMAVEMTHILMGAQVLFALSGFFSSMLQGAKRFIIPAFSPVFYNVGIALSIFLGVGTLGLYAAAWGTVIGAFLQMIIQIPLLLKLGFRPMFFPKWNRSEIKQLLTLTGPRTAALAVNQLTTLGITFFALPLGDLSLTIMNFAQTLMALPIRFFGVSIAQAALPFLAATHDDIVGFRKTIFRSLRQIAFFSTPASVLLLVLRVPMIRLAYGADTYTWKTTILTAETLGILALSIAPQAITHLLIRAFYALNNTITPLVVSSLYFILTIALCWLLTTQYDLGVKGIAIALSLSGLLEMILLLILLLHKIHFDGFWELLSALSRTLFAGFLMGVTLFVFQRLFDLYVFETSRTIQLIQLTMIVSAMGAAVYIGLCWILKIEELTILQKIYSKLRHQWDKTWKTTPSFAEPVAPPDSN